MYTATASKSLQEANRLDRWSNIVPEVPEDWWRYACHRIHHPLACFGTDDHFIWCNTAYEQLLGYPLSRLKGLTWPEITVLDDVDMEAIRLVASGHDDSFTMWSRYRHRNGDEVPCQVTVLKFPNVGEITCFVVEAVPATATRQDLEQFKQSTDELIGGLNVTIEQQAQTIQQLHDQVQALTITHEQREKIMSDQRSTVVQVGNNSVDVFKVLAGTLAAILITLLGVVGYLIYIGGWSQHGGGAQPPEIQSPE